MIKYSFRSIALLNIVNEVKAERLVPDAYFQRNLVWREVHKKDFIETILQGYPFPQMFFSRGKIDVDKMSSVACIVDGQQRTNAIIEYVDNKFSAGDKYFKELDNEEKSEFLKYEIAVVELDLDNDSPHVLEIFKRLNRTSNSLTTIEKLASEFSATEYMYVARLIANDTDLFEKIDDSEDEDWRNYRNIPQSLITWAKDKNESLFKKLNSSLKIFSDREISRKVHIMYILNIMSTLLGGFFNRNERTSSLLEDYKENFPQRDQIFDLIENSFAVVTELSLEENGFWAAKANFFSLIIAIAKTLQKSSINIEETKAKLIEFSNKPDPEYTLAAREAVNNKKERQLRHEFVINLLA